MKDCRPYLPRFDALIKKIDGVDFRVPEDSALIGLANDLVPRVTRLLRDSLALLDSVAEQFERQARGETSLDQLPDTLEGIAQLISAETAEREIEDLAFFARAELREALDVLVRSMTANNVLMTASHCESGLRRARRALVSVEAALYTYEELEVPARDWVDVEVSLQIRKLYRNLRQDIVARPFDGEGVQEDLVRAVLYRLVAFRELRIYPYLRVDDRVFLRDLLRRMLDWLNSKGRDVDEARSLWQDLTGFAQILAQVSYRQELREHDYQLVAQAYHQLFGKDQIPDAVPRPLLDELDALLGLDDELDRLILEPSAHSVSAWRAPLRRLLDDLRHAGGKPRLGAGLAPL
ncbi:MAG: hypothetical protein D6696_08020 [Acidobacteria bacterium]|nr:MAG: hypothetical protein D6696_08020 [Acidobacteriota bacterium]